MAKPSSSPMGLPASCATLAISVRDAPTRRENLPSNAPKIEAALAFDTPGIVLIMETLTSERTCSDWSMAGVVRGLRALRTVLVRLTGAREPPTSGVGTCLCMTVWSAWLALTMAPHVSQTSLMEAEESMALCDMSRYVCGLSMSNHS